jgi:C-terminal processing protease CtpA/Prc
VQFAVGLKDYGLARLVGAETGGPASSFGELIPVPLPHTGLLLQISCKRFVRPSGVWSTRGVLPDYAVPPLGPAPAPGLDGVLAFTRQAIINRRRNEAAKARGVGAAPTPPPARLPTAPGGAP